MTFKSICAMEGVTQTGMKEGKFGLALIRASGTAAGVFTANLARAAPVELMRKQIKTGKLEAVIVNSGCANAYTGNEGIRRCGCHDRICRVPHWGGQHCMSVWQAPVSSGDTLIYR